MTSFLQTCFHCICHVISSISKTPKQVFFFNVINIFVIFDHTITLLSILLFFILTFNFFKETQETQETKNSESSSKPTLQKQQQRTILIDSFLQQQQETTSSISFTNYNDGNDLRAMHEHEYHEEQLANKTKLRRNKSVRRTSIRVEERKKLKASSQLRQLPTFGAMDSATFQTVVDAFVYMEFPHDAIILLQGKPSDKFCVLVKGVVEISVNRKDNIENNVDGKYS